MNAYANFFKAEAVNRLNSNIPSANVVPLIRPLNSVL